MEGLMRGIGKGELPKLLVKAAADAGERCLPILGEMAAPGQAKGTVDGLHHISLNTPPRVMEACDFVVSKERIIITLA
jgi:hypothetical protein